ncbi:MAG: twin-arginine translocase TatA/TatE family subunit [Pirellulales bacterium]|nr:twin-arginine translocase TatA/TatE family subunit [Pirellulales bacterium]
MTLGNFEPLWAFLPQIGPSEMLIVGIVAVLLFGKRLPEVGRSLGRSMVEFKKGMRGIEDELTGIRRTVDAVRSPLNSYTASRPSPRVVDDRDEPTAPKFEPPSAEPKLESPAADAM